MKVFKFTTFLILAIGVLLIGAAGVDLTQSRVGLGMIVCALGGALIAGGLIRSGRAGINAPFAVAIVLASLYFMWRALSGGPVGLAISDVTIVLILLGSYLAGIVGQTAALRVFVACLGVLCVANAVIVGLQLTAPTQWFIWRDSFGLKPIASGFFGHYNYLAAFLNGSMFLFLTLSFTMKSTLFRVLCGLVALLAIASLVASGSRGGWVSFVVGFGVWVILGLLYMKSRRHPGLGVATVVSLMILVGLSVTSLAMLQKLTDRRVKGDEKQERPDQEELRINDGGRVYFQQMAFDIFQESPVIGNGPRSFEYLALEHWDPEEHANWHANPVFVHNEYLQVLADYGIAGFLIIIGLVFALFVSGFISVVLGGQSGGGPILPLKIGALCGLAAMLSQCYFSFIMHVPSCALLVGILVAIVAQKSPVGQAVASGWSKLAIGSSLLLVAGGLGFLGLRFAQSYQLVESAKSSLADRDSAVEVFDLLEQLEEGAEKGYDYGVLEVSGRLALRYSTKAFNDGNEDLAEKYAMVSLRHFEKAIELNPHSGVALVMIPHVYDALGEFEKAEIGYAKAMEKLWVREFFLKAHLYAAKSRYRQGLIADGRRKSVEAARHFRVAVERLEKRTEVLRYWRELPEDKELRMEIEARVAYLEGELLFQEGDRVWKEARPRQPELAYGLMLAAAQRYEASQTVVEPLVPRWKVQWKQLQENLKLFETVRTKPALLTEKQITRIINPEAGLDPEPATR